MMTRDEFLNELEYADDVLYPGKFSPYARNIAAHDQAQREEIEQQAKLIQELEEWKKIVTGSGTDQETVIRMAATEYTKVAVQSWKEKCEQQAKEIAELRQYDARTIAVAKTTSSTVSNLLLAGPLTPQQIAVGKDVEIRRLAKENQALREALQFIARQYKPGNWAVELAKQALKEVNNGML